MATVATALNEGSHPPAISGGSSAVSWPAVFAGATAAAALSLILLVLGTGLGLSTVSPWAARGASAAAISWATIGWIAFAALASSGLGGYLAGRLRVRWPSVHTDEVYFRDTAHGLLAWAVATLLTAAVLTSTIGTILSVGTTIGAAAAGTEAVKQAATPVTRHSDGENQQSMYLVDALFRTAAPTVPSAGPAPGRTDASTANAATGPQAEIARIFDNSIRTGPLSADDTRYAGQLVAQRTGLSQQDAETRVTNSYTAAQQKMQQAEATAKALADRARKEAAYASLWIFVSLLLGAFSASLMATVGGRRRDLF